MREPNPSNWGPRARLSSTQNCLVSYPRLVTGLVSAPRIIAWNMERRPCAMACPIPHCQRGGAEDSQHDHEVWIDPRPPGLLLEVHNKLSTLADPLSSCQVAV